MEIAHSAAGEAGIRPKFATPASAATPALPHQRPRTSTRSAILPRVVAQWTACASDPDRFAGLDCNARRVLQELLRYARAGDPRAPIFVRSDRLAQGALIGSSATLYRALKALVDQGWLEREQKRRGCGEYSTSHRRLTDATLIEIGAIGPDAVAPGAATQAGPVSKPQSVRGAPGRHDQPVGSGNRVEMGAADESARPVALPPGRSTIASVDQGDERPVQDRVDTTAPSLTKTDRFSGYNVSSHLPSGEHPPTGISSTNAQDREARVQAGHPKALPTAEHRPSEQAVSARSTRLDVRIPSELEPLLAAGLAPSTICWLMREARRLGKPGQLGCVMRAAGHAITRLAPRDVAAYLQAMLARGYDYRGIELRASAEQEAQGRAHADRNAAAALLAAHDGGSIQHARHGWILRIEHGDAVLRGTRPDGASFVVPINQALLDDVAAGLWVLDVSTGATTNGAAAAPTDREPTVRPYARLDASARTDRTARAARGARVGEPQARTHCTAHTRETAGQGAPNADRCEPRTATPVGALDALRAALRSGPAIRQEPVMNPGGRSAAHPCDASGRDPITSAAGATVASPRNRAGQGQGESHRVGAAFADVADAAVELGLERPRGAAASAEDATGQPLRLRLRDALRGPRELFHALPALTS